MQKLIYRDKEIKIRLSKAELNLLKEKADDSGKKVSMFVRDKALGIKLPARASKNNQKSFLRLVKP